MPAPDPVSPRVAFLGDLADSLGHAVADNGDGFLVHVAPGDDGYDVGVAPLDGEAPADVLLGSVAPEHWWALGVAARAWARPLDGPSDPGARDPAEVVVLVDRSGAVVSRMRHRGHVVTEVPAWGHTLDCLQRALRLPTAPPAVPASVLFAATWLERVVAAGPGLTWREAQRLHPALQVVGGSDVAPAAEALARSCDWERLRWLVVEGTWVEPCLVPADAAWFDAGAFSRWVLAHHAPPADLLAELPDAVSPVVADRCSQVLDDLGLAAAAA